MSVLQAIFLGILQGLTEFLPVSSSGHLVLAQSLIPNFTQPGIFFDVVLHAGTLLSVLIYFRKTFFKLTSEYLLLLFIGTIPAVIVGLLFGKFIESFFVSTLIVGLALIVTSFINFQTDNTKRGDEKLSPIKSLIIGAAQAIAIIPGISRSGSTIFAASKLGVNRQKSAEFSFILSTPAIIGANLLQFIKNDFTIMSAPLSCFLGFLAAFVSGYFAIGLAVSFLKKSKFKIFGIYCFFLGVFAVLLS